MKQLFEVDLLWYTYSQNNSGGHFVEDENQGPTVSIQATSSVEAWAKAKSMFDFDYCECCGERWFDSYYDDEKGDEVPMRYGEPLRDMVASWYRNYAILHYYDGRVERIEPKEKNA